MIQQIEVRLGFSNFEPRPADFYREVLHGLRKEQKELYSKYFYDERGSQLFEQICSLDEYYVTRVELEIMQKNMQAIAELLGPHCQIIEYGSGNSKKTRLLLDALPEPTAYVPIDISKEYLLSSSIGLAVGYPNLEVMPICADYTSDFEIPQPQHPVARRIAYFPGSTISNFDPEPARRFLRQIANACEGLLIGVDLKKDFNILHRAYNDSKGVTAQFNMNMLARINRELGADFQLDQFRHYAFYNPGQHRIEMHLVSLQDQEVHIGEEMLPFAPGESIWTESSYKYTLAEFARLAASAGFSVANVWTDPQALFSVQYLTRN
ncbi:MAG: L-histidine N(alpha)-methyltransferase [Ktedonobacteraceae bacterium]|nr:L-histidine N(alpha)-methyltransferase [Ktedonobacteraceae bacterium]MBO0790768.1 L-histidine N(alpha)-methyltransferase [Ktedonobacteraceae bacterium]